MRKHNTLCTEKDLAVIKNQQFVSHATIDRTSGSSALEKNIDFHPNENEGKARMSYQEFLKPEFGESVLDRLDKIGKVKLNMDTLGDDERKKLKCKTLAYVMIELVSVLIVIFAMIMFSDEL